MRPRSPAFAIAVQLMLVAPFLLCLNAAESSHTYGVFKSTDRARTWSRSDQGITGHPRVNAFAALGDSMVAGTDSGIFLSEDQGENWRAAEGASQKAGRILSLASLGRKLFAGTQRDGLLVSSDLGKTWSNNVHFRSKYVRCLLAAEGSLYAGTDSDGTFVSRDGGHRWSKLGQGLPVNSQVFALAMLNGQLFAGLYSQGLYRLESIKQNWTRSGNVSPLGLASTRDTLIAGHNPGGIHWSGDLGANWSQGSLGASDFQATGTEESSEVAFSRVPVWELVASSDFALAGAGSAIYRSETRGKTWFKSGHGLPDESTGVAFLLKDNIALAGLVIKEKSSNSRNQPTPK